MRFCSDAVSDIDFSPASEFQPIINKKQPSNRWLLKRFGYAVPEYEYLDVTCLRSRLWEGNIKEFTFNPTFDPYVTNV
jgi:hypothetical protein